MKLELVLDDNMIRDRIRKVRLAYGRDPQCISCGLKIKEKLDELYEDRVTLSSIYTGHTLYGIPILISASIHTEELLFLMDIDSLQPRQDMEDLPGLPELLV